MVPNLDEDRETTDDGSKATEFVAGSAVPEGGEVSAARATVLIRGEGNDVLAAKGELDMT